MEFKTRYSPKTRSGIKFNDKTRTKQEFKEESDINNIMKKYETTGKLPDLIKTNPKYGDFSQVQDYQTSMNIVLMANEQFNNLSSKIRRRFNNDPKEFLQFATDAQNMQELIDLGLAIPKENQNTQNINNETNSNTENNSQKTQNQT